MTFDEIDLGELRERSGEKWATYPADVLPAWVADMDLPLCAPIRAVLDRHVAREDVGYPTDAAVDRLREVFSARARDRFRWEVAPERVEPITDVVQGLYIGLLAFSQAGDGAIVQTPVYPPFLHAPTECERSIVLNPLAEHDGSYEIDRDHLEHVLDTRTRVLLFCNPQNPTGRAFRREELEALAEIVLKHDLIVCSDEIHADLVYDGHSHTPFATLSPEVSARTVTLTSATKAFNIAGLRCAVAVFGSEELQRRFNRFPAHLRGALGSLGLAATQAAWTDGQPWLDDVLAHLDRNRRLVAELVESHLPGVAYRIPEATYLAWLDCRALDLTPDPYRRFLERGRVALSHGAAFGPDGVGFVRLNFATSRPILEEIVERMRRAVD